MHLRHVAEAEIKTLTQPIEDFPPGDGAMIDGPPTTVTLAAEHGAPPREARMHAAIPIAPR